MYLVLHLPSVIVQRKSLSSGITAYVIPIWYVLHRVVNLVHIPGILRATLQAFLPHLETTLTLREDVSKALTLALLMHLINSFHIYGIKRAA